VNDLSGIFGDEQENYISIGELEECIAWLLHASNKPWRNIPSL